MAVCVCVCGLEGLGGGGVPSNADDESAEGVFSLSLVSAALLPPVSPAYPSLSYSVTAGLGRNERGTNKVLRLFQGLYIR